jgi:hypothetical protein
LSAQRGQGVGDNVDGNVVTVRNQFEIRGFRAQNENMVRTAYLVIESGDQIGGHCGAVARGDDDRNTGPGRQLRPNKMIQQASEKKIAAISPQLMDRKPISGTGLMSENAMRLGLIAKKPGDCRPSRIFKGLPSECFSMLGILNSRATAHTPGYSHM